MTTLAEALEAIESKTGATLKQQTNYLTQAVNEGVTVKLLQADDNSRPDYPITPIPFPDFRGWYKSIRQLTGVLYDNNGKMRTSEFNAAIHAANHYPKLYEYTLGLYEENQRLKQRNAELESELES